MSKSATRFRRDGEYGFDAPYAPIGLGLGGVAFLVGAVLNATQGVVGAAIVLLLAAVWMFLSTASYIYTTRRGKFAVWAELLASLRLRGDERLLDLGCGRGAVLLMAAQLLPRGEAVGVDLWKTSDQSGNDPAVTRRNAAAEGVAGRVALETADMRALPFADGTFDLVVSSLAIHNIPAAPERAKAVAEAARVLKPGGRVVIADIRAADEYAAELRRLGLRDVALRPLGWRFWYGGPWVAARLVTATKPD
ncbi:MAG TPA: class I SAM-dependent methyltransferase [Thermomicrobiales bacterium]|nr:class I SAM-dependent methyltransferase [Thermomicrobiales bacterium]